MSSLMVKPGAASGEMVSVTQERAGWETISLRMIKLDREGSTFCRSRMRSWHW